MKKNYLLLSLSIILLFLSGCCANKPVPYHHVADYDEAGSTHIAVTFVAPWEEIMDDLQPKFEITAEKALGLVLPKTSLLDDKFLDALKLSVKIAPPLSSTTQSITESIKDGLQSVTSTKTEEKKPGDTSSISMQDSPSGTRTATGLTGASALGEKLESDPMLQHSAAVALYQEIKLLNQSIRYAALRYNCRPYVVRIQVSVMPAARNEPYDAYATFSFFESSSTSETDIKSPNSKDTSGTPFVIPLLVTDNLETSFHSQVADTLRQLAFGIGLMIQGVGASAEIGKVNEQLKSILGKDYSSLLTVARVSDNTVRVRLGAQNQVETRYTMIPRTHTLTLVLLVPKKKADQTISVITKMMMRDVETGVALKDRTSDERDCLIYGVLQNRFPDKIKNNPSNMSKKSSEEIRQEWIKIGRDLLVCAQKNNYNDFENKLSDLNIKRFHMQLWVELISLMAGSQYASTNFDLPKVTSPEIKEGFVGCVIDDGKKNATLKLNGGRGLVGNKMSAVLKIEEKGSYRINADQITTNDNGREVILVFPSLSNLGFTPKEDGSNLSLDVVMETRTPWEDDKIPFFKNLPNICYKKLSNKEENKPNPGFEMTSKAKVVVADKNGKGSLKLYFTLKPDVVKSVSYSLEGPDIESVTADPQKAIDSKGNIVASGVLTLKLFNLNIDQPLIISAKNDKGVSLNPISLNIRMTK